MEQTVHPRDDLRIGWTTLDSPEAARKLATSLVQSRLAACVQIDPPILSIYAWKGAVESESEIRLWVKYAAANEEALQDRLRSEHPYETPQWIAVTAAGALPAYADWIRTSTT
ncbi:MAG TPA: divalent-cation tolerance protein CutA [Oceanipulchritudo sp.]|nr:divalent-cation tolerance protein CutA [Oceanipulchritudo sp.]